MWHSWIVRALSMFKAPSKCWTSRPLFSKTIPRLLARAHFWETATKKSSQWSEGVVVVRRSRSKPPNQASPRQSNRDQRTFRFSSRRLQFDQVVIDWSSLYFLGRANHLGWRSLSPTCRFIIEEPDPIACTAMAAAASLLAGRRGMSPVSLCTFVISSTPSSYRRHVPPRSSNAPHF